MLIEYQNTKDDLLEFSAATNKTSRAKRPRVFSVLLTALFLLFFVTSLISRNDNPEEFNFLIPMAALSFQFIIIAVVQVLTGTRQLKTFWPWVRWLAMLIFLFFGPLILLKAHRFERYMLQPHIIWICVTLMTTYSLILRQRKAIRSAWQGQPSLHRVKTADISVDGVVITNAFCCTQYKWSAFVRWEETRNLFLLFVATTHAELLPKKAFHNDEELNAFRSMARAISPSGPTGFPVSNPQPIDSVAASPSR